MLKVITDPLVGFLSLGLILVALVGRIALPGRIPGALAAVRRGQRSSTRSSAGPGSPRAAMPSRCQGSGASRFPGRPSRGSTRSGRHGGRCRSPCRSRWRRSSAGSTTPRARSPPGDHYRTRDILLTEALATILAGLCGGVVQNTPYVGPSGLQGDGRAGRVHPGHRAPDRPRGDGRRRLDPRRPGPGSRGRSHPHLRRARDHRPGLRRHARRVTPRRWRSHSCRRPRRSSLLELSGILGSLGLAPGAIRGEAARTVEALRLLGNGFILIGAPLGRRRLR